MKKMIKDKKLAKNFIWNTIGSTLASFSSVFLLIMITRMNGIEEAGVFTITFATASIFYIIAVYSGRNCQITDIKGEITNKEYIVSRIITCLIMAILVFFYVIIKDYDTHKKAVLIFLCIWKGLEAFNDVLYGTMQKNGELYKVGISLILRTMLGMVSFFIVNKLTHNLVYATIALCISSIITIIGYDFLQIRKILLPQERIEKKHIMHIYQKEFFLFINAFFTMYILNASKYAIENYLTEDIQAVFGIILMPASILPLFAQFIVAPLINQLTDLYKDGNIKQMKHIKRKSISFIIGFGMVAIILGYTIGIPVLNFIYNVDLTPYRLDLAILLFAYIFYAMGYVETILLTIYRKMKEQFFVYVVSSLMIFALSYGLINKIGVRGASLACAITMITYCALLTIISHYQTKKQTKR